MPLTAAMKPQLCLSQVALYLYQTPSKGKAVRACQGLADSATIGPIIGGRGAPAPVYAYPRALGQKSP